MPGNPMKLAQPHQQKETQHDRMHVVQGRTNGADAGVLQQGVSVGVGLDYGPAQAA